MNEPLACIDGTTWTAFLEGELVGTAAFRVRRHLAACADCALRLEAIDTRAAPVPTPSAQAAPSLERGAAVGRYVVLEALGTGGMSEVYAAFDPELDRKVALKVLRRRDAPRADEDARLLREAQAMARISHPNILAVYDAGISEGRVFFTMEFVRGTTLRQWQLGRTPRELLDVYIHAGRGLAAAHAAGLVHRDFKPDNVLVDERGLVKVTDFGIARSLDEPEARAPSFDSTNPSSLSEALTRDGIMLGTPGYMAPEQYLAVPADGRADQFSFCTALWEALHGERPFGGRNLAEFRSAVLAGLVREPAKHAAIRPPVRRALLRGLAVHPDERFPSLDALLDALAYDPSKRRTRAFALLALCVGVAGAVAAVRGRRAAASSPCDGAGLAVGATWNDAAKTSLAHAFRATGRPLAEDALARTLQALDGYAERWAATATQVCEAERAGAGAASSAARSTCLEHRHGELRALVRELAVVDGDVLERAVPAALALPDVGACADESPTAVKPPPADPTARVAFDALRSELAQVRAQRAAGRYEAASTHAESLVAAAKSLGHDGLLAEALEQRAGTLRDLSDYRTAILVYKEASWAADRAAEDERKATADLAVMALSVELARFDDARDWGQAALAAAARTSRPESVLLEWGAHDAWSSFRQGKYAEAETQLRKVVSELERRPDTTPLQRSHAYRRLAAALSKTGAQADALAYARKAYETDAEALGREHPMTLHMLTQLTALLDQGARYAEALSVIDEALGVARRVLPPEHLEVATLDNNRGEALRWLGRPAEALHSYEKALAFGLHAYGPDHIFVGLFRANIGLALLQLGRVDDAAKSLEEARRILATGVPEDHEWRAHAETGLGDVALRRGHADAALVHLRRAERVYAAGSVRNPETTLRLAQVRFLEARALDLRPAHDPTDADAARRLAELARRGFTDAGWPEAAAEVKAWLMR